jgi:hypothetical protein
VSPKVHQNLVMDLPKHPHRVHYVVDGVQNVIGGTDVHHEGGGMSRLQTGWTPYCGGALVP